MVGSAIEAASTSSECLSGEDSEPPPALQSPVSPGLSQDQIRIFTEALISRRPRTKRSMSTANNEYEAPHHLDMNTLTQMIIRAKAGLLFPGKASPNRVRKREQQISRQWDSIAKRRVTSAAQSACNNHGLRTPRRTPSRKNSVNTEASSPKGSGGHQPAMDMPTPPAPLRTARSTPGDLCSNWSNEHSEPNSPAADRRAKPFKFDAAWESKDPVARGLREEIERVQAEKQEMVNRSKEIDRTLEKLGKIIGKVDS